MKSNIFIKRMANTFYLVLSSSYEAGYMLNSLQYIFWRYC